LFKYSVFVLSKTKVKIISAEKEMPGTLTLEIKAIKILQINTYTHA